MPGALAAAKTPAVEPRLVIVVVVVKAIVMPAVMVLKVVMQEAMAAGREVAWEGRVILQH